MKKLILVLSVVAMAAFLLVGCLPKTNTAPVITYSASQTATVGTEFISTVTATDAENDTLIFSVSDGPTGMVIDSATGVISGRVWLLILLLE
jgi:outer membrane lipoprotein SlyB